MAKSAMPLLLVAGGAALLLTGKKKKKKKTTGDVGGDTPYTPSGGEDVPVYTAPPPADKKPRDPSRPVGSPPRGSNYDAAYWGSNTEERLISIRQHFVNLGYPVQVSAHPMNILGPKGDFELENIDGSKGKLGGNDDRPNPTVTNFQRDYNRISRLNKAEKFIQANMGGLADDGAVGPLTLNGLRTATEVVKASAKGWKDLLLMASNKGIS